MNELSLPHPDDEPADENYCARVVKMLLSGYPNQEPKDPVAYGKFLIAVLVGKPRRIVKAVVDPHNGVIAGCQFLPTVADLNKWLEPKLAPKYAPPPEHRKFLPAPPEPEIPPEERAAGAARLRELADSIRAKQREKDRLRFGIAPLPTQAHDPAKLMEALANNLERRGMGDDAGNS